MSSVEPELWAAGGKPEAATAPQPDEGAQDVPTRIFTEFLAALRAAEVSPEIVARLSKTLLDDKTFSEVALKAVFNAEVPPL